MRYVFYVVNVYGHSLTHMWGNPMTLGDWDKSDSCLMVPSFTWSDDDVRFV